MLRTLRCFSPKHVAVRDDRAEWSYGLGLAAQGDIASTLHRPVLSVLPIGIAVNQLMPDPVNNAAFEALAIKMQALPTGGTI